MCTSLSEFVFVGTFLWDLCHCTSLCKLCTEEGWFADVGKSVCCDAKDRPDEAYDEQGHGFGWQKACKYASNQKSSSLADITKSSSTSQGGAGNAGRQEREHCICTPEE